MSWSVYKILFVIAAWGIVGNLSAVYIPCPFSIVPGPVVLGLGVWWVLR